MARWQKGTSGNPAGRPPGHPNFASVDVKQLARELVLSPDYRKRLRARLHAGELHGSVETTLWHYAFGKPVQSFELHAERPRPLVVEIISDADARGAVSESAP